MIKNEIQAQSTEKRLHEIKKEILEIRGNYPLEEVEFWAWPLEDEALRLQGEIDEYNELKTTKFEIAVEKLLQEPVLLENISDLLAKLRISAKLTQQEMAVKLNWRQPNVSRFENENYSSQSIDKISEYLGALGIWLYVFPSLGERKPTLKINRRKINIESKIFINSQPNYTSTRGTYSILECGREIDPQNDSSSINDISYSLDLS